LKSDPFIRIKQAAMDLFDDNEDDDDNNENENVYMKFAADICNIAFIEIMRLKPFIKRSGDDKPTIMHRNVLVIGTDNDEAGCATLLLIDKLKGAQYIYICIYKYT
jgi:hypothetical protein